MVDTGEVDQLAVGALGEERADVLQIGDEQGEPLGAAAARQRPGDPEEESGIWSAWGFLIVTIRQGCMGYGAGPDPRLRRSGPKIRDAVAR